MSDGLSTPGGYIRQSSTVATPNFLLSGSTSGTATLKPPAAAGTAVVTLPGVTGTLATLAGTETLTNKTLTSPTITTPTITGAISANTVASSAQVDATTNTTLANVTGLVQTVVPGSYKFTIICPGTAGASGGIKLAFKLTTTVLTSIEATGLAYTASAVAVQHTTTTTDQTSLVSSTSAAILSVIEGTMVVGTGGTIQLQMAQNASNGTTSSVYVGSSMMFSRYA